MERLPEHGEGHGVVVRRWTVADAEVLHALVVDNRDHLRPRMAWVPDDPKDLAGRRALIEGWDRAWLDGGDLVAGIWSAGTPVGGTGLHRRRGPGVLEIGYWVDRHHLRRGIARRATAVVADLAFGVAGIEAVDVIHDVDNVASRAIPESLGFRWLGEAPSDRPLAAADTGRDGAWRLDRSTWLARGGATLPVAG
ncbi:MAG: GNAT family N-acetyltransferase [Acidimicrobiales bacterium]|nr:GNAT family N-acetyltransferase [Acidimicrobiales bacterium]